MRKYLPIVFSGSFLACMAGGVGFLEAADMNTVLRAFDSAAWRFQLAEIVGILSAIKRKGAGECDFTIDDEAAQELNAWLEQPSTEVPDTSVFVTRRNQVEGIMGPLLKLAPAAVCHAAEDKLPGSLKPILRR